MRWSTEEGGDTTKECEARSSTASPALQNGLAMSYSFLRYAMAETKGPASKDSEDRTVAALCARRGDGRQDKRRTTALPHPAAPVEGPGRPAVNADEIF